MDIYLFTKSIIIRGNYILSRNHIHFKELKLSVHSRKCILVQGKHIYSGTLNPLKDIYLILRNIYSLKFKAICSFKEIISKLYSLNIVALADIAEIFIQKLSSATL